MYSKIDDKARAPTCDGCNQSFFIGFCSLFHTSLLLLFLPAAFVCSLCFVPAVITPLSALSQFHSGASCFPRKRTRAFARSKGTAHARVTAMTPHACSTPALGAGHKRHSRSCRNSAMTQPHQFKTLDGVPASSVGREHPAHCGYRQTTYPTVCCRTVKPDTQRRF